MHDRPVWFVDVDSVLNNLHEEWRREHDACCVDVSCRAKQIGYADWKNWDTHTVYGCGTQIYSYLKPDVFRRCAPQPNSVEVMRELDKRLQVLTLSSATPKTVEAKGAWLARYYPFIPKERYCWMHHKWLLRGDGIIDDRFSNVMQFCEANPGSTGLLMAHPWNEAEWDEFSSRGTWRKYDIFRVDSWADINAFCGLGLQLQGALCLD